MRARQRAAGAERCGVARDGTGQPPRTRDIHPRDLSELRQVRQCHAVRQRRAALLAERHISGRVDSSRGAFQVRALDRSSLVCHCPTDRRSLYLQRAHFRRGDRDVTPSLQACEIGRAGQIGNAD